MKELICICCPKGCHLKVDEQNGYAVTGNNCPRGEAYGKSELQNPVRVVTSTVRTNNPEHRRLPVKTDRPVSKSAMLDVMAELEKAEVRLPVNVGDIIIENVAGTGANIVAAKTIKQQD